MAITVFLVLFWVIFWIAVLVAAAALILWLLASVDTSLLMAIFWGAVFLCGALGGLVFVYSAFGWDQFVFFGVMLAAVVVFAALSVAWEIVIKPRLKGTGSN